ncbi:signal recognition particle-docking protein FtsY [Pseudomonas sp. GL93]|uniref:signal recognition particle-docking protein FtsY n=1 Tax=Pseudomonas sp. GL93 TaxID=2014741 RepID=UPI000E321854|nr:signal recognition particle-docking protein FtsY [Pseudomonas sp. GL93]RFD26966.1 signal recognition particle-docking protein FtsY [Pseudomonas sp. GL93]
MFGSNDDKKTPAAAGEKKGLFGWLRKKPQETVVEQPQVHAEPTPEPVIEAEPVAETPVPVVLPMAEPVLQPVVEAEPEPEPAPPEHKPWLELPVAEEPVALVEDVQAEHLVPPIPAVVEPARVEVVAEVPPVVEVPAPVAAAPAVIEPEPAAATIETSKTGFFARLKQGLSKTSASIGEGMASLFLGKKVIDDELLEDIETRLLTADVGVEATAVIIQSLTQKVARKQLTDADALYKSLQAELAAMLKPVEAPLVITPKKPFVILVVGVNGAGKTTTIGKLAKKLQGEGKKVMLAAGDTFRAAAVEQLQVWGERNKIPVIAQHTGADSASVIFDAVQAAKARNIDVLIADTAGRLHTKDNLMEELKKVRRVIGKLDADAPHEVLLVLDAGTGQNAISQAKQFNQTVQLTGLALTKLDGTAKGGVIFALAKQFGLPIRYIGVGEGIDDLRTFEAEPFVQALFAERERS